MGSIVWSIEYLYPVPRNCKGLVANLMPDSSPVVFHEAPTIQLIPEQSTFVYVVNARAAKSKEFLNVCLLRVQQQFRKPLKDIDLATLPCFLEVHKIVLPNTLKQNPVVLLRLVISFALLRHVNNRFVNSR
uniref:CSON004416 protein n=1 Tax=Culicoides sonorensis TaxID=179676 RepID=A0A336N1B3_CULSO